MTKRYLLALICLFPMFASAYPITSYLEMVKVNAVGNSWTTLTLDNTYTNPVVVCTHVQLTQATVEGSTRVQIVGSAIQVRVQRPLNGAVTPTDVYCTISQAGSYTSPIKYEAHTVDSFKTNRSGVWNSNRQVNVTSTIDQDYTNPVVTGQVMSNNDPDFVEFWSSTCASRQNPPTNIDICVGKHTGESGITAEFTETLGYFIAEQAEYNLLPSAYVKIALGADTIQGTDNGLPGAFTYTLPRNYTFATAVIAAIDGGDGGWAVLYGSAPINTSISLGIAEDRIETINPNNERAHTPEQVSYWVMEPRLVDISLQKTAATISDPINITTNPKAIPGAIIEYTITAENSGTRSADANTIVLADVIPSNTKLCVATVGDCLAPYLTDGSTSSGLSLNAINYSNNNATTYSYSPTADAQGADSSVTNVQATTSGSFLDQTGASAPSFSVNFRVILE